MDGVRVSDGDRERVVVRLGAATAEGRLTLAEFEDRSGRAYASKTAAELANLVADLPAMARGVREWVLAGLALLGGVVWMPLFPYLDYGAVPAIGGMVFGLLAIRATSSALCRAVALLGLLGGVVGTALQLIFWVMLFVPR